MGESTCIVAGGGPAPVTCAELYRASAPVGLLTQMTVVQRQNERLRQQLRDVNQDRSLLAAGLQHDLRGPLTSIYGAARTLIARHDDIDSETRANLLSIIEDQSERLSRMLTETLTKQTSGPDGPLKSRATSLRPLAERVATAASAARPGEVVVESPDIAIVTDPDRLERALLNLLDNALKYAPEDAPPHLIVERDPHMVSITVADKGPGVSPEVLPSLFGAYTTDPTRQDGTGLGLHSVRQLVAELGGRVGYSRHSDWTRFTVALPLDRNSS
jgi:signal transduction histidine kinase